MAITIDDTNLLHKWAKGVMQRAEHHAGSILGTFLVVVGGITWRGVPNTLNARTYNGEIKNVITVKFDSGRSYYIRYDHHTGAIEIRDNSNNNLLYSIINSTHTSYDIYLLMKAL